MRAQRRVRPVEAAVVFAAVVIAALSWVRSLPRGESAEESAPPTFRVAAVQMYSRMGDLSYNRAHMAELARRAAGRGAKVVVFPEAAVTGYVSVDGQVWTDPVRRPGEGRSLQNYAEPFRGKSVRFFSELAGELDIYIVVPFVEYDRAQKRYFNTLALVGPKGEVRAHYRKLNPWPGAEATWSSPGDRGLVWADTEFGRLGLLICYDVHSVAERLAARKVDTLLYPIAWVDSKPTLWFEERLPARADQLGVNIVAANWTFPPEREPPFRGAGYSRVISAGGKVLAASGRVLGEEIVMAELPVPPGARREE